jgi:hypothetical protein
LIQDGVLTLHITQRDSRDSPCAGRRQRNTAAGMGPQCNSHRGSLEWGCSEGAATCSLLPPSTSRACTTMRSAASPTTDQAERDEWIAIFERMGVTIFDSICAEAPARCTLSSQEY